MSAEEGSRELRCGLRDLVVSGDSLVGLWRHSAETLPAMHPTLFTFIYLFAVAAVFLGTLWLIWCFLVWIFRRRPPNQKRPSTHEWRAASTDGRPELPARRSPNFVPPPTPQTDQEYWQAEQYHFDHGQPAPLPPPRRESDEW